MNFARYLKHTFNRKPRGDCFCSMENYFTIETIKNSVKKPLVRKTTIHAINTQLNHYFHQVFISFNYSKISLFLFSLLPMIHWKDVFLEKMLSYWGFIDHRKLFLIFGNLTLISVNTKIFVKTNNKHIEWVNCFEKNSFSSNIN